MSQLKRIDSHTGQDTTETVDVHGTTVVRDVNPNGTVVVRDDEEGDHPMLTRSQMDDLRAQIADATDPCELRALAVRLHGELERARIADDQATTTVARLAGDLGQARRDRDGARDERDRARRGERDARRLLAGLIAASKATLAAFADNQPESARSILGHELYARGWQPTPGSHATQILADAAAALHDAGLTQAATAV